MNILFLAPYPENESPSQRYRFEHYLPALRNKGIGVVYKPFLDLSTWYFFFEPGNNLRKTSGLVKGFLKRWMLMLTINKYDYVYIHREVAPAGPPVFEWIIAKVYRKKIIYDFDDAIWVPNTSENNKFARYFKWFGKVKNICKWAYKISAGNDYLAKYALNYNHNVFIIPTVVDTENVHNQTQDQLTDTPAIGWTGSFSTLKYLSMVLPVLQRLQEKYEFTFIVIADKNPELDLKNYQFIKWDKEREAEDLLKFHIGLMPLTDNEFAKGKCGFKAIQYMSLGIPAVVSPVGVNTIIVDEGINGFVCSDDIGWDSRLALLLEDSSLRIKMSKSARQKIELKYSVMATQDSFLALFS